MRAGGQLAGPNPTDRGKSGSKYHLLVDHNGLPLQVLLSRANTDDSELFEPLLDTVSGVGAEATGPDGPRRRPEKLHADEGYDYPRCRRYVHRCGITECRACTVNAASSTACATLAESGSQSSSSIRGQRT